MPNSTGSYHSHNSIEYESNDDEPIEEYEEEISESNCISLSENEVESTHQETESLAPIGDNDLNVKEGDNFIPETQKDFKVNLRTKTSAKSLPSLPRSNKANRKNLSFTNDRLREIERHNKILLQKIIAQRPSVESFHKKTSYYYTGKSPTTVTNAAVNRKKQQFKIDFGNQVLKRKIEEISRRRPSFS